MSLRDALLTHKPRETSGGPSANRYAFQRTWALCHALQLHESRQDYVLVLEYHDDVLVLDRLIDPTRADFFQVKTKKTGVWSLKKLLQIESKRKDKENPDTNAHAVGSAQATPRSILGRLIDHVRTLSPHVASLNLVSNAPFKVTLSAAPLSEDRESFVAADLDTAEASTLAQRLREELGLAEDPDWGTVGFTVSSISLLDHQTHGIGKLSALLDKRLPDGKFAVRPLFKTLADEIEVRSNCEWQPTSYEELSKKKAITRDQIEQYLKTAELAGSASANWASVQSQLTAEGISYRQIEEIQRGWERYEVERINRANVTVQQFRERLVTLVETAQSAEWSTMKELVDMVARNYAAQYSSDRYEQSYLHGAILFEQKANQGRKSPAAPPQPENTVL